MDLKQEQISFDTLLTPKIMRGQGVEYTLGERSITITNLSQPDSSRRRIDIPLPMLGRFISELQEIEKICKN